MGNAVMENTGWIPEIQEIPKQDGSTFPVFRWRFGQEKGATGIDLTAWITAGALFFKERRDRDEALPVENLEVAAAILQDRNLPQPPHLTEVLQDVVDFRGKFPFPSREKAEEALKALREKWGKLLAN